MNFEQFKTNYRFIVQSGSLIPHVIKGPHGINLTHLDSVLKKLTGELATSIALLNDESTWAAETNGHLKSLSHNILSASSALATVKVGRDYHFVENDNPMYRNYQYYFNIKESHRIGLLQFVAQDIGLLYLLVLEMSAIRMDEAEIRHFLVGAQIRMETYLELLRQAKEKDPETNLTAIPDDDTASVVAPRDCKISTAFFRWINCHYDFAQNMIHAKYQLDKAVQYCDEENHVGAAASIIKAGELTRASTSSMVFACMMPPKIYQDYIRPSMGLGFTGVDNPQWAAFNASKKKLLAELKGTDSPLLLNGLKILFENLLQDIEVHTSIAAKMIGNGASLTVEEINAHLEDADKNVRSATADLRNLHYFRLKEFEFLNIYPILSKLFSK